MTQNDRPAQVAGKYAALIAKLRELHLRLAPDQSQENGRLLLYWYFEVTGSGFTGRIREAVGETGYEPTAMLDADLTMLEIFTEWLATMTEEQVAIAEKELDALTRELEEALGALNP